jgi:PHD/YefM family antitoxin component YafN of YafNO toxin-antitoxin module
VGLHIKSLIIDEKRHELNISANEMNGYKETFYLLSSVENRKRLRRSMAQARKKVAIQSMSLSGKNARQIKVSS